MTPHASKLSVTIITRDEEACIADCLESVRWAEEIIVVDTGSVDRTIEICQKYTPHVESHPWQGYAPAKNAAIERATGEWILSLDADERVSSGLSQEIRALQQRPLAELAAGYTVPRRNYLWGRWLRHGGLYPDYQLRLFQRGRGAFTPRRVHESVAVDGRIEALHQPLEHYSYQSVGDVMQRLERYTALAAQDLYEQGQPFRVATLVLRPLWRFVRSYVLQQGMRDGVPGLIMAVSYAYGVFVREAKLWEMARTGSAAPGDCGLTSDRHGNMSGITME